jgi:hypothetical protein
MYMKKAQHSLSVSQFKPVSLLPGVAVHALHVGRGCTVVSGSEVADLTGGPLILGIVLDIMHNIWLHDSTISLESLSMN